MNRDDVIVGTSDTLELRCYIPHAVEPVFCIGSFNRLEASAILSEQVSCVTVHTFL